MNLRKTECYERRYVRLWSARPLRVFRRRENRIAVIDRERESDDVFQSLKKETGQLSGQVPGTEVGWAEAVGLRIEYRADALWLLMEPSSVWVDATVDHTAFEISREFIRRRLADRYNVAWNNIISAWIDVITAFRSDCTVQAFGIGDGCDASFTFSGLTGFSWREGNR